MQKIKSLLLDSKKKSPAIPTLEELRLEAYLLQKNCGLLALKGGTEVEDMDYKELALLRDISADIVPLYIKIGGVDARNDIRESMNLGVDVLIAPMLESPYALMSFVKSVQSVSSSFTSIIEGNIEGKKTKSKKNKQAGLSINIETKHAYKYLDEILESPYALEIDRITAARSDLSASLQEEIDSLVVLEITNEIIKKSKKKNYTTSIGGGVALCNIETLIECSSDQINTRHSVIAVEVLKEDPCNILGHHLKFEEHLYTFLKHHTDTKEEIYLARITSIQERLNQ